VYFKSWPICGPKPGYRQRDTQEQYSNLIGQNTVSQLWKTVIVKLPEDCRPISNGMTLEAALKEMTDFWDHQSLPCGDSIACEQGGTKEVKCRLSIRASATLILAVCQCKGLVHGHRQPPGEKQAQIDMYEFWRRYFLIHHRSWLTARKPMFGQRRFNSPTRGGSYLP